MVNLIQFQQAYSAAAKLITTADEMVDTLLSMVR
jgi:flagellar hook-associated protein FlgK